MMCPLQSPAKMLYPRDTFVQILKKRTTRVLLGTRVIFARFIVRKDLLLPGYQCP